MTKEEVRAALARGETITIGKVLAGTTLTKAMLDDMMLATLRGEAIHTYFDGHDLKMERVEMREMFDGEMAKIAHESGRKVPQMSATDQPTSPTATNTEPGDEGPKPRHSG